MPKLHTVRNLKREPNRRKNTWIWCWMPPWWCWRCFLSISGLRKPIWGIPQIFEISLPNECHQLKINILFYYFLFRKWGLLAGSPKSFWPSENISWTKSKMWERTTQSHGIPFSAMFTSRNGFNSHKNLNFQNFEYLLPVVGLSKRIEQPEKTPTFKSVAIWF